jgi:hypothetical protein
VTKSTSLLIAIAALTLSSGAYASPPNATTVIESGGPASQTALANKAIAQHAPASVGFMWAVLNYRARSVPHNEVPNAPIKVGAVAKGFAVGSSNAQMGQWIYDNFANDINISSGVRQALTLHHSTPADFDAAYGEVSRLVNVNFKPPF